MMSVQVDSRAPSGPRPSLAAPVPLLRVAGLSVRFGDDAAPLTALDGVSFDVMRGETVCLVGESGSGKTVAALSILRLEGYKQARIVAGDIVFDGVNVVSLPEGKLHGLRGKRIGMIFQEPMTALDPVFTIGEQIVETILRHEPTSRADAWDRAVALLARVKIPDPHLRMRQIPQELSGGMRQRAMIAMALACGPDLLIADEPTTALDVTTQAQILLLLKDLQSASGMAILLITHDLGIAAAIADRVVVMYAGRVAEKAPVDEMFEQPWHPYTRGLLRSAVPLDGERRKLPAISGAIPRLDALPTGCRFHPRCPLAAPACRAESPALQRVGGREVACWYAFEGEAVVATAEPAPVLAPAAPAGPPLLRLIELSKRFELRSRLFAKPLQVSAVDDVSLEITRGETFGLVGESGCGKSTLGRLIMQLERPSSGEIYFDDLSLIDPRGAERKRIRREMQMVFQDPSGSIDPRWTVEDVVAEPLVSHERHDRKSLRSLVEELLVIVGLDPTARTRYAHEFSGGQRQRIAIARAIALRPKFLVADEAVSALDLSVQAQIVNLLDDLRARLGLTCLFIGHGLHVVRHLSDRIGVMYLGRLVEVGPASEVFRRPAHHYTHDLIASIPSPDRGHRKDLASPAGELPSPTAPPPGCHFHPRCPAATQRCLSEAPPLLELAPGRRVACHYPRV
jgi:peptide/nickel transport system ATP-binding protein